MLSQFIAAVGGGGKGINSGENATHYTLPGYWRFSFSPHYPVVHITLEIHHCIFSPSRGGGWNGGGGAGGGVIQREYGRAITTQCAVPVYWRYSFFTLPCGTH